MKVKYRIKKKRGYWRPVLTYRAELEPWEMALAVDGGDSGIRIPEARNTILKYCPKDKYERAENPIIDSAPLLFPYSGEVQVKGIITLPWRPGTNPDYSDIEKAFQEYLKEWERRVFAAMDSSPMNFQQELEHSEEYRRRVAPYVAKYKMINEE